MEPWLLAADAAARSQLTAEEQATATGLAADQPTSLAALAVLLARRAAEQADSLHRMVQAA